MKKLVQDVILIRSASVEGGDQTPDRLHFSCLNHTVYTTVIPRHTDYSFFPNSMEVKKTMIPK